MSPRELRVCCREIGRYGQHGRCHAMPFELHPDPRASEEAKRKLARFTCDEHGNPIILVPLGTFPRGMVTEDDLRGRA